MKTIITSRQNKHQNWGFKDPRTCLTFFIWKKVFDSLGFKPKYILINRKIDNIAKSMIARGNQQSYQQLIDLANSYYKMANLTHNFEFTIEFENLIKDTDNECKRLSEYLQMPIINNNFIEQGLVHQ
jgi:hypothetical protein